MKSSNTFHNRLGSLVWFGACLAVAILTTPVHALQPNRLITEYIRERWDGQRGFPGGSVNAIAQTMDGYLWLGTEKGLVRFDGLSFQLFNQTNSILPSGPVMDLLPDKDGNLWIRPQSPNLILYRDGNFQSVVDIIPEGRSGITAMCHGLNGEALFAVRTAGVFTYRDSKFQEVVPNPNMLVISVAITRDGTFWMGTRDFGLFYSQNGHLSSLKQGLPDTKINALLATDSGLWIGTDNGLAHWDGTKISTTDVPTDLAHTQVLSLASDSDSNVWVGTSQGLLLLNSRGVSALDEPGQVSKFINRIFEDREGNLWIGSRAGLERLRDTAFVTYSASKDPSATGSGLIYVDQQGRRWIAPAEGGLYWQKDKEIGYIKTDGLDRDVVYSLMGNNDELWVGRKQGGLTLVRLDGGGMSTRTYTQSDGLPENSIYALGKSRDGTVWAASLNSGVSSLKDGRITSYTTANGLASNSVSAITEGADGTLWFATTHGLTALSQGSWKTYSRNDNLPPGRLNCLIEDASGNLWIGTDNGVIVRKDGRFQVPADLGAALREPVLGMAIDRFGYLWMLTTNHVLSVSQEKWLTGNTKEVDVREFGLVDGLRSLEGVRQDRSVFVDPIGQIWFSTYRGLSVVDPSQIAKNLVPAIAHIEGIVSDGETIELKGPISISSSHQRITFRCSGLSLSTPERVRFKYRLDGYDHDWSEPIANRDVVYTNLGPGPYRFRLLASNSAGLWTGTESFIDFEIQPQWWQRTWVRLLGLVLVCLIVVFFYRLRLRRLADRMNLRFEERLAERTRIAQDLHDTLLQGFLSVSMQMHVVEDQLPADSPAKPLLGRVLKRMTQVTEEGRAALKTLRTSNINSYDLAQSFSKIQDELDLQERIDYRVTVDGPTRTLQPIIRDEIYHIGREALMNAFRHAQATLIEMQIEYGLKHMRILVRDDGQGIDSKLLRSGREGHWGIPGMRERAEVIGAKLRLWSRPGAGTEVELSVPGKIAYESQPKNAWSGNWFARFLPRLLKQKGKKGLQS